MEARKANLPNEIRFRRNVETTAELIFPISVEEGPSHFSRLMSNTKLPPPGPSHYEARRNLWLTPSDLPASPPSPSPSRIKLEALLSQEGAVEDEILWKSILKNVWMGLVGGNQLRKRLPLNIVVCIFMLRVRVII